MSNASGEPWWWGLSWPLPEGLDDGELEARLYPPPAPTVQPRAPVDFGYVHRELRRV